MRSGGWGDRQTLSISFSLSSQSAWALRQKLRGLRQRPLNATLTHKGLLGRSGILRSERYRALREAQDLQDVVFSAK